MLPYWFILVKSNIIKFYCFSGLARMERNVDESIGDQEESGSAEGSSKVVDVNDVAGESIVSFVS